MRHHRRRGGAAVALLVGVATTMGVTPALAAPTTTMSAPKVELVDTGYGASAPAVNPATNRIYVPNSREDTLSVIDGRTNEVRNITTSHVPMVALVDARRNAIYAVTMDGLDVIDGATERLIRTVPKVSGYYAAVNSVTGRVYVASRQKSLVHEYDPRTQELRSIPVGRSPSAVAVNERLDKVYVASAKDNVVTIYDGATATRTKARTGERPVDIAVNQVTGKVYVANVGDGQRAGTVGTLTVVDGATDEAIRVSVDIAPAKVAVDVDADRVLVISERTFALTVLDGRTNRVVGSTPAVGVGGIAIDGRASRIYVGAAPLLAVIDARTFKKLRLDAGGRMMAFPAFNPANGKVYVNNPASGNVAVLG